ncbi:hypothetical protein [Streptomyces atratus]|uniref:hypothetical protein n=1 Tax=Streptomyces atratus TaxID=1893 RepID=UPI0033EB45CE
MITVSGHRISLIQESSDWMDADNARIQRWHRGPAPLERPSRSGQLIRLRQQFRREATERRNRHSGDRQLRVLAYSLVLGRGASPDEDWNTLQTEAEQRGYAIGARLHDVAVPVTTTYFPGSGAGRGVYMPPWKRPGWGEVERLIRGGFADGVIVLDRHNISSDDDEYHAVIKELGERYQAFVHLVIPEEPSAPT